MASRPIVPQQPRGGPAALGVKQKPVAGEGNNRKALGDIGNLVNVRGGVEGKPQQQQQNISRPITRSFGAQLLAKAQTGAVGAAANNKSIAAVDGAVGGKDGTKAAKPKVTIKPKPEMVIEISPDTEEEESKEKSVSRGISSRTSSKKSVESLSSVLTARSKFACGLAESVHDIDAVDSEDQLAVVDYVEDIYKFYRLAEKDSVVHDYMGSQVEINSKMRSILTDWLIEVHNKFELMPETLYLTIHIVDRYLSMKAVLRKELQLVGITAMLIACKYEEIWAPEINDFICISDRAYSREQILVMEKKMLNKLEWSLTVPTPYVFLVRFLKAALSDKEMEHMVFFFAELALTQYCMIMRCPSMIAASAVYAARCTLQKSPLWNETLKRYTGFAETQLVDCTKLLVNFHSSAADGKLKAVHRKYSNPLRGAVALLPPSSKFSEESKDAAST
ncbi:G2/mitotic-specific cyclin S13-7-like [Magnolia sinica]|uniref:G2/mitotic-specific cyclin S13-7-like n=1 Tax=Magnolia sinica TaxID=86752 RepID=UPI0026589EE1|nr:G2/mitotic-specific cyclin S13-7-like [Magnolia sinica]